MGQEQTGNCDVSQRRKGALENLHKRQNTERSRGMVPVLGQQVRKWCRKNTNISVANLYALADCLNCKPEDLLIAVEIPESRCIS